MFDSVNKFGSITYLLNHRTFLSLLENRNAATPSANILVQRVTYILNAEPIVSRLVFFCCLFFLSYQ